MKAATQSYLEDDLLNKGDAQTMPCGFIWVDKDKSGVRGHSPGKSEDRVRNTEAYTLDPDSKFLLLLSPPSSIQKPATPLQIEGVL